MASAVLYANLFFIFAAVSRSVSGEIGCPPPEDVAPCTCSEEGSPVLTCSGFTHPLDLQEVFEKSERYSYAEVHITNSSMLYIPSIIFDQVRIYELHVKDSSFIGLFDSPLLTRSLRELHLRNARIQRGFDSRLLNSTNLEVLTMHQSRLRKLSETFSMNLPSSLRQMTFSETGMVRIDAGALSYFPNLDKFAVISNDLKNISRSIFPRPSNVRFLSFDNLNITSIPEDLFSDMPNLQILSMRNNRISVIPESAFSDRSVNVPVFRFDGNPLQCNCLLLWVIKDKPEVLGGECSSPARLRGKALRELSPGNFNC